MIFSQKNCILLQKRKYTSFLCGAETEFGISFLQTILCDTKKITIASKLVIAVMVLYFFAFTNQMFQAILVALFFFIL